MDDFSNFKNYLIKFEYPNINFMDDDQIDDIFSMQNRYFLFKWLMKLVNSQFNLSPEWSKVAQTSLADFLSQCGFCRPYENLDFVQKSGSLSKNQEVEIFQRIFDFLQNSDGENLESSFNTLELETFLNKNVNLFPSVGVIKLRSSKERNEKIEYLNNEIANLTQKLENYTESDLNLDNCCLWSPEETKTKLDDFRSNILRLRQVGSNISYENSSDTFIKDSKFKQELGDRLSNCSSKTNEVVKYFKNINEMQIPEFEKLPAVKSLEQDEVFKLSQQLAESIASK